MNKFNTANGRLFLDIHALQTVPPSNINRDDTGRPKTSEYGGVTRSRVSSQAWKKAVRDYFHENSEFNNVGVRTLRVPQYLAAKIQEIDPSIEDDKALEIGAKASDLIGAKTKKNKDDEPVASALFFIGEVQAKKVAQAILDGETDKKVYKELINQDHSIDLALFGRMVADDPSTNVDASSQFAHAISTHAVRTEYDFFVATDDFRVEDNAGAGMLGNIEFNSSTLYRYANANLHELSEQVGVENLVEAIKLYVKAFILSMPTGKVNTFANTTLPQAILLVGRHDRPTSLVSAFETPVYSPEGFIEPSVRALAKEYNNVQRFLDEPEFALYLSFDDLGIDVEGVDSVERLDELLEKLDAELNDKLSE